MLGLARLRFLVGSARGAVVLAIAAALLAAFVVGDVPHPPGVFPKYATVAADMTPGRELDYSPLYLAFTRATLPLGRHGALWVQAALFVLTAVAVAVTVERLARGWGWLGGLLVAGYRPFIVHAGIAEPETLLVACLVLALLAGVLARERLVAQPRAGAALAALSAVGLALATLARPQHLLLLPLFALWIGARASGRTRWTAVSAGALAATLVLAPVVVVRWRVAGVPTIMNPGPVFYEGNGPGASGLTRHAPELVHVLERAHPDRFDYGHVAYRRLAGAALGRDASVQESNRYWIGLAVDAVGARPGEAALRFARKALMAVMPYEAHDLRIAEDLDRKLRRRLPLAFAVPLCGLVLVPFLRRSTLSDLGGPLAVALVAVGVQVVFYASARQRLPLALGLLVALPVVLRDVSSGSARGPLRRGVLLSFAAVVVLSVAFASGGYALANEAQWSDVVGRASPSLGERLASLHDGRALRGVLAARLDDFLASQRSCDASALESLDDLGDVTIDDTFVGVPRYWAARCRLRGGERQQAADDARAAMLARPSDVRVVALSLWLDGEPQRVPAGVDPADAAWARAQVAMLTSDRGAAASELAPFLERLPELGPTPTAPRGGEP